MIMKILSMMIIRKVEYARKKAAQRVCFEALSALESFLIST
jgi:hypothetical protein